MARPKGSKNMRPRLIREAMRAGQDPVQYMLSLVADKTKPDQLRLDAAKNVAPYLYPRLQNTTIDAVIEQRHPTSRHEVDGMLLEAGLDPDVVFGSLGTSVDPESRH